MAGTAEPLSWSLSLESDNLLQLKGLTDQILGTTIDAAASVVGTLYDSDGNEVAGVTWPVSFTPVGSGGNYNAILPDTAEVTEGEEYEAKVVADDGPGRKTTKWIAMKAEKQR